MAIINFQTNQDFDLFLNPKLTRYVGEGAEGMCYVGRDGYAYKTLSMELGHYTDKYNIEDIITDDQVNLDSFAFPIDIYTVRNNELAGYKAKFAGEDLFSTSNVIEPDFHDKLDRQALIKAYYVFLEDLKKLSEMNIKVIDMPCNLLFDGKKFTAIDTCQYKSGAIDSLPSNIDSFNTAIEDILSYSMGYLITEARIENTNIESYLDKTYKEHKKLQKKLKKDEYLRY